MVRAGVKTRERTDRRRGMKISLRRKYRFRKQAQEKWNDESLRSDKRTSEFMNMKVKYLWVRARSKLPNPYNASLQIY